MTEDQKAQESKTSPYQEVFDHLEQCKRILEEWEAEEKALEAEQVRTNGANCS